MLVIVDNSKKEALFTPMLIEQVSDLIPSVPIVIIKTLDEAKNILHLKQRVQGIIFGGGPLLLSDPVKLTNYSKNVLLLVELSVPQLHICFGAQVLASVFGGIVEKLKIRNKGMKKCRKTKQSKILHNLPEEFICRMAHRDVITHVPFGFDVIARGSTDEVQGIEREQPHYFAGLQFHPESSGQVGKIILSNFLRICNLI